MMHEGDCCLKRLYYERSDDRFHHVSMPYQKFGHFFSNDTMCQAHKIRKFHMENV